METMAENCKLNDDNGNGHDDDDNQNAQYILSIANATHSHKTIFEMN